MSLDFSNIFGMELLNLNKIWCIKYLKGLGFVNLFLFMKDLIFIDLFCLKYKLGEYINILKKSILKNYTYINCLNK